FTKNETERAADRQRLNAPKERILRDVPGTGIASDQDYRVADLAVDFCEDVPRLPAADVERIVAIFEDAGASAKISSIHVNGWFGAYDKLSMTERCLKEIFGIDIHSENERIVFVGDSPNDSPMFSFFTNSVGVANVRDFDLPSPPAWVTKGRSAAGFCEVAEALLAAKA
ncbi:MAG: HAD family hydrolase, partial [Rhodospirillales bacterium]|nr:HAD family hydrolase [Rhodospirillales bacterium]